MGNVAKGLTTLNGEVHAIKLPDSEFHKTPVTDPKSPAIYFV